MNAMNATFHLKMQPNHGIFESYGNRCRFISPFIQLMGCPTYSLQYKDTVAPNSSPELQEVLEFRLCFLELFGAIQAYDCSSHLAYWWNVHMLRHDTSASNSWIFTSIPVGRSVGFLTRRCE